MLFTTPIKLPVTKGIIKSIGYNQDIILADIITLHTGPIELDPTYGNGAFYNKLPKPKYCFDIQPKKPGVVAADVRALPLANNSISCINFDPPFMARTGPGASMKKRFGELIGKIEDLWEFYDQAMQEIYRVLKLDGWLIFKCQDGVLAGVNNNTYCKICNMAEQIGYKWVDMFVLLARHRMNHPNHHRQFHARKFHCYFIVFRKSDSLKPKTAKDRYATTLRP